MAHEDPTISVESSAKFYVLKHGEMFGPFDEAQLREGAEAGNFASGDFTQMEGEEDWRPVGQILGMDVAEVHGAVAPDWKTILNWGWLRLRYNLGEQSLQAGGVFLAIGTLTLALSRWPFLLWLPWFGGAVVCAIPLLRRKKEAHGALLLVGVVCIPFLFAIFGSRESAGEMRSGAGNAAPPSQSAETAPPPLRLPDPANANAPGPKAPGSQFPSSLIPGASAPQVIAPHYAPVPSDATTPASLPSPPVADRPPLPASATPAPPIAPTPAPPVDFAHEHSDSLVIVKGSEGSGSGFICRSGSIPLLYTNVHVIADIADFRVSRIDGTSVSPSAAEVAAGRDIARLAIAQPPAHPLDVISDFENNVRIGDNVVVLGNSGGGGVVTKIDGKIVGIGPDRIEVSAEFIPGNSGSPIIHSKTGQVIGIATYLTKRYEEFAGTKGGAASEAGGAVVVRRFGYRIDNVPKWERVEWNSFRAEATTMRQISKLTGDIFDFLGSLRSGKQPEFATDTLRRPAADWLATLKTKHLSEVDRQNATRGFMNSMRAMSRGDVATAESRLRYTYFREELQKERQVRDVLYKAFDEQSARLSEPNFHPTSTHQSP